MICMSVLLGCLSVYYIFACCSRKPEEGTGSPELELQVFVSYPGGYRELSPSPWQERPVAPLSPT